MKVFKAIFSIAVTLLLISALEFKWGALPPIAPLINPNTGFWQNAESKHIDHHRTLKLDGIKGKVTIQYDENMVPHIFAENEHDLYFAQGYITATDRLWQMDIQTRQAAGRLSEVIGPKTLEIDRYHRRTGMVYAAEQSLKLVMRDPRSRDMILAYTDGVNAYIHQLWKRDYPLEFKLLDYQPEDWKPINCLLLLKLMTETLAGHTDAAAMTNVLKKYGPAVVKDLYPDYPFREKPIIPEGTPWNFKPLQQPKPSASYLAQIEPGGKYVPKPEGIGSNNWAVAGSKTASGYPILANDPHLDITLPSIWYQLQLSAPGINVNGVSIPGSPCVIIGYNNKVSWGVTNVGSDVLDFYKIDFKDATRHQYRYGNGWRNATKRIEKIGIRGQQAIIDTVVYTHQGPVVYNDATERPATHADIPINCAMRWIAYEPSADILCFYQLNRAQNYDDYRKALTNWSAPGQNFIFADADKDIAITVNGRFPLKYKDQGKFILNGADPGDDWQGWIPFEQNPTAKNPAQGYLTSANQSSTDQTYPYYLNWSFAPYERGKRINDRLTAMTHATVDSMRILQTDTYSISAQNTLPAMLGYLNTSNLNTAERQALNTLAKWNKHYDANSIAATIMAAWWQDFYTKIWSDNFDLKKKDLFPPNRDRTVELLLKEPTSHWFDDIRTHQKETCADLVNVSFRDVVKGLIKQLGPQGDKWQWGHVNPAQINHLTRQAGLGSDIFYAGGMGSAVNALNDGHGPSWRMVVQTGPQMQGYGIYPGGESGNPGSFHYTDMVPYWQKGQLKPLLFLQSASEKSDRIKKTLTISSK